MTQYASLVLALDKSVRRIDVDGRLHVAVANISKANVCGYLGAEIPGSEALGLQSDRMYQLLRHPDELAKAAPTFNNLPLLSRHVPVTAANPEKGAVIGSTGTDAAFVAPYLTNSLVVWDEASIAAIEHNVAREISCGYHYKADMTPGEYEGEKFDGIMRDIVGNHAALVEKGRAGPDVVVGDQSPPTRMKRIHQMAKAPKPNQLSRRAVHAHGALSLALPPLLAADAKIDLPVLLKGVTAKNWDSRKAGIIAAVTGKLAHDASIQNVMDLLDQLDGVREEVDGSVADEPVVDPAMPKPVEDEDPLKLLLAFLRDKLTPEDCAKVEAMLKAKANDADPTPPKAEERDNKAKDEPLDMPTKPAMDAAIAAAVLQAETNTVARLTALHQAKEAVRPFVGALDNVDTAEGAYRFALDAFKAQGHAVVLDDVPPPAYGALFHSVAPLVKAATAPRPASARMATDAASAAGFTTRFPNAPLPRVA